MLFAAAGQESRWSGEPFEGEAGVITNEELHLCLPAAPEAPLPSFAQEQGRTPAPPP